MGVREWFERRARLVERVREQSDAIRPPSRNVTVVTTESALSLSTIYRAVSVNATAVSQLSLLVERDDLPLEQQPALICRPDPSMSRSAFLEYTTTSLACDGNAFWYKVRSSVRTSEVIALQAWNPHEVAVYQHPETQVITFSYRGEEYTERDVQHLKLLRVPGSLRGLGPIQSARVEVQGALEARDYGSLWFSEAEIPNGILSTDQNLTPAEAKYFENAWHKLDAEGQPIPDAPTGHRVRVLGKGLSYTPVLLKPADVQFLERQQFDTLALARLFGIPASLMLTSIDGDSRTYQNVEQEWIGYTRFSLMKYLREIEEAFSDILPGRQTARFKVDNLQRSDTKSRYEGYQIALQAGFMTVDEIRSRESLGPLPTVKDPTRA